LEAPQPILVGRCALRAYSGGEGAADDMQQKATVHRNDIKERAQYRAVNIYHKQ